MPTKKTTTEKNIWKTLSAIDVNKYKEEKGGLDYLPWAHAVALVKEHYPAMRYYFDSFVDGNGNRQFVNMLPHEKGWTGIVGCTVEIEDLTHHMVLPVMNFKMQATLNPNAKDITNSLMRCLVKTFAMFGLGHYLYTGDSLPNEYEDVREPLVRPVVTKKATIDATKIKPITNSDGTPINPNQTTPTIGQETK